MARLARAVAVVAAVAVEAASSSTAESANITQVHIAFGPSPSTQMTVAWVADTNASMAVHYGVTEDGLHFVSSPSSSGRYTINNNFWGPYFGANLTFTNYTSGWIHHTNLTELLPRTTYFYRVGNSSKVFNFTTALPPGATHADGRPQAFSIVGDVGQTSDSILNFYHMVRETKTTDSEAVIIAGDLSYADCDQPRWDTFGEKVENLAAHKPFMVGPGNHEIEYFRPTDPTFLAYESRYFMPAVAPARGLVGGISWKANNDDMNDDAVPRNDTWCTPSEFRGQYEYGNAFYSFTVGLVHFISLNCYGPTSPGSGQYTWLEQELTSLDRDLVPWVVISVHCPWYSTNTHHYQEWQTLEMQANMEDLFLDNAVNLVVAGHVHAYQRSYPVYKGEPFYDGAPVYVVVGDGGNREGHAFGYHTPDPAWSAYKNDTQFGHGTLIVYNETHMKWQWHINEDPYWRVRDEAWITRSAAAPTDDDPNGGDDDGKGNHHKNHDDPFPVWLVVFLLVLVGICTVAILGAAWRMEKTRKDGASDQAILRNEDFAAGEDDQNLI